MGIAQLLTSTIFREENFVQTKGEGKLEVRGGNLEIALFLNGEPLIFDAADCGGSVGRFTTFLDENSLVYDAQIAEMAAQGFQNLAPLQTQIEPLLRLLPDGNYRLTLETMHPQSFFYCWEDAFEERDSDTIWYYPADDHYNPSPVLFTTQPQSLLNRKTVISYSEQIGVRVRPALITIGAKNHLARFVLDGHHKLFAYQAMRVAPPMLHIECEKMAPISYDFALQISKSAVVCLFSDYLKYKKQIK